MDRPDNQGEHDQGWASEDIPVRDTPIELSWNRPVDVDVPELSPLRTSTPGGDSVDDRRDQAFRPAKWVIAGIVAIAVGGAVVLQMTADDKVSAPAPTTAEPVESTVSTVAATVPAESNSTKAEPAVRTLGPERLDLPPEIAAIVAPTEIVAIGSDGVIHTVSLPSGRVRSVAGGDADEIFGLGGPGVVVAPDAAAAIIGSGLVIVPRVGTTVVVDGESFDIGGQLEVRGWSIDAGGGTVFRVVKYGNEPVPATYDVSADGSVAPVESSDIATSAFSPGFASIDGSQYVNEAGGVYRIGLDGTAQRIDTGTLMAVTDSYRLVRTCTEALDCGFDVVDQRTGERRPVAPETLSADFRSSVFGYDLAPDGSAVSALRGTSNGQERVLVDLADGSTVVAPTFTWDGTPRWAADSSGVFDAARSQPGLDFLDRASGTVVHFGDELGSLVAVGTRAPEAELEPEAAIRVSTIQLVDGDLQSPTGLVVLGVGRTGVASIDVDRGEVSTWGSLGTPGRRPTALPLVGGVAVLSDKGGFRSRPGDEVELPIELLGDGQILPGPDAGTAWTTAPSTGGAVRYRLVDLEAGMDVEPPVAIEVPMGSVVLGGDGRGGLLVEQGGDVYVVTAAGAQRLTTGEVLAIGEDVAYLRECDDRLACSVTRVDRASGERTSEQSAMLASAMDVRDSSGLLGTSVGPGGNVVFALVPVVHRTDGQPDVTDNADDVTWAFVDLETGRMIPIDDPAESQPVVWSADGQHAAVLIGSSLVLYDRAGSQLIEVTGTGPLRALATVAG